LDDKFMAMTADDIASHPELERCVRSQAQTLLSMQENSPRIASVFATQQRWLMAHAALAQYFRNEASQPGAGLVAERFLASVAQHQIASRNTASAFLKEMQKYEIVGFAPNSAGKRRRALAPAPAVLMALFQWHVLHLSTLDGLDSGTRAARFLGRPTLLQEIQPLIADGLIASSEVREPQKTFSLFTWINEGGVVMDRLIAGCQGAVDSNARILTDVTSISGLAERLRLSRTQLSRKFTEAEAMGSLGWSGTRGWSALWLSSEFLREYHAAQAAKLAIIDAAFAACA
jgi:AraC-like DNA-binding protein